MEVVFSEELRPWDGWVCEDEVHKTHSQLALEMGLEMGITTPSIYLAITRSVEFCFILLI